MKRFFYGIGHCMVDYFAQNVEQNIFEAIKKTSPRHLESNDFSNIFSQISPQTKRLGGTSINILKKLASLGEKCLFSGSTGTFNQNEDDNALFIKSELSKQEIEFQIFSRENSTGQFLTVYNSDCEKTVVVSVGAAKEIEVAQVNEIRFAHCSCFIMEGMQFMNQQVLEQIVDFAFRYNILLVIDCGTVFGAEAVAKRLFELAITADFYRIIAHSLLRILAGLLIGTSVGVLGGLLTAKIMNKLTGGKINPLIGSAGVSAVPMAARVAQSEGQKADPSNFLLMHAMGPNVAGVIGSAVAAGVLLACFR